MQPYKPTLADVTASYPSSVYTPLERLDERNDYSPQTQTGTVPLLADDYTAWLSGLGILEQATLTVTDTTTSTILTAIPFEEAPAAGEVAVDYDRGLLKFHSSRAGNDVEVTFTPYGTVNAAMWENTFQKEIAATQTELDTAKSDITALEAQAHDQNTDTGTNSQSFYIGDATNAQDTAVLSFVTEFQTAPISVYPQTWDGPSGELCFQIGSGGSEGMIANNILTLGADHLNSEGGFSSALYFGQQDSSSYIEYSSGTGVLSVVGGNGVNVQGPAQVVGGGLTVGGNTTINGLFNVASSTNGTLWLRESGTVGMEFHIRPAAGKNGFFTFTEDSVSDRWVVGITGGSSNLTFGTGNIGAYTSKLVLGTNGIASAVRFHINTSTPPSSGYWLSAPDLTLAGGNNADTTLNVGAPTTGVTRSSGRFYLPTGGTNNYNLTLFNDTGTAGTSFASSSAYGLQIYDSTLRLVGAHTAILSVVSSNGVIWETSATNKHNFTLRNNTGQVRLRTIANNANVLLIPHGTGSTIFAESTSETVPGDNTVTTFSRYGSINVNSSGHTTVKADTGKLVLQASGSNANVELTPNGTGVVSVSSGLTVGGNGVFSGSYLHIGQGYTHATPTIQFSDNGANDATIGWNSTGSGFVFSDVVKPAGYLSTDGSAGLTQTVIIEDATNVFHTLTFKNGLLTAYSSA